MRRLNRKIGLGLTVAGGLGVLVALSLVGGKADASGSGSDSDSDSGSSNWASSIRELAMPLEITSHWPGLSDFLVVVAYTESRGNPDAGSKANDNAARGWFGLRPTSTLLGALAGRNPNALHDPKIAVVAAADYADRLFKYRDAGVPRTSVDWEAIRRGWALPVLVPDVLREKQRSRDVYDRMLQSEAAVDLPGLHLLPASSPGTSWIGLSAALSLLGAK